MNEIIENGDNKLSLEELWEHGMYFTAIGYIPTEPTSGFFLNRVPSKEGATSVIDDQLLHLPVGIIICGIQFDSNDTLDISIESWKESGALDNPLSVVGGGVVNKVDIPILNNDMEVRVMGNVVGMVKIYYVDAFMVKNMVKN
jgi:hypothetical protein